MPNELVERNLVHIPAIIARSGGNAGFAYEEFFKASISNEHTRRAYARIVGRLLAWCETNGIELRFLTPGLAGDYIGQLEGSAPTKNQALAALRHFFDAMVTRHVVPLNSFASVRGVKYSVTEGKTAEISIDQARKLLRSIDTNSPVGMRDRAVLGVLAYTGARVNAVAKLRLSDYRNLGEQRALRFREKGGKDREIPVRHDLQEWLNEYVAAAGIAEDAKVAPLFRAADGKRKQFTRADYKAHSIRQMMKRRLDDAGLPELFSPHSFRVTVVTDLLNQDVPLEDVQYLAGHASPTTTRVYDRRRRRVTRNIVERISI
jgi:site-specific recombinase XerD